MKVPDPDRLLGPRPPSPLQEVDDPRFSSRGLRLLLKRDDLVHPELPGNKWRKLAPNLRIALREGHHTLLTFGGAYSHHLRATATAGRLLGLRTVGVVRGDELAHRPLNPSLEGCARDGMTLHFVSRSEYRQRHHQDYVHRLRDLFGPFHSLPEGGSNGPAVHGCHELGRELLHQCDPPPTVVGVACGTGGTLAGLAAGLADLAGPEQSPAEALGFPVLRGGFLGPEVERLQREAFGRVLPHWRLVDGFHCGGYARTPPELVEFAEDFAARHGLPPLERLYVAKLLRGLTTLAERDAFPPGGRVVAVVTGPGTEHRETLANHPEQVTRLRPEGSGRP
ncbi:pyridoxal-phosphate dependent enzyme [Streptomyces sp. NPDC005438]|uniref:1-aminocyclopropane-1-carboxylate deaminase/D-cysteine desulfhydrase n=1 Tax=Streptomyces sp. NPDC005438 TaxID=3156880 RepID=UPI0033BA25ED